MSLTDRDRKIVMVLVPLLLLAGYWFFILSPKRAESQKVSEELTEAQGKRDTAQAQVGQLNAAKASFTDDYATVIRMGKAVPESVDMPSLLVQLDRAARGTGISIKDLKVSNPQGSGGSAPTSSPAPGGGGNPGAGGSGAQSMPGKNAENAGNAVNNANDKSQQSADKSNQAAAPSGPTGSAPAQQAPGLSSVGLQFELRGDFFDLADFFHRMKRFVRVVNDEIVVRGRLISVDSINLQTGETKELKAQVNASVYLSPKQQGGVSAGASPNGPAATPASGGNTTAPDTNNAAPSPANPTATATP